VQQGPRQVGARPRPARSPTPPPPPPPLRSPLPASAAPKPSQSELDTAAAKTAIEKRRFKDARSILQQKVKNKTATEEDIEMLEEVCAKLKDKSCMAPPPSK
jgi:hypothetical protein